MSPAKLQVQQDLEQLYNTSNKHGWLLGRMAIGVLFGAIIGGLAGMLWGAEAGFMIAGIGCQSGLMYQLILVAMDKDPWSQALKRSKTWDAGQHAWALEYILNRNWQQNPTIWASGMWHARQLGDLIDDENSPYQTGRLWHTLGGENTTPPPHVDAILDAWVHHPEKRAEIQRLVNHTMNPLESIWQIAILDDTAWAVYKTLRQDNPDQSAVQCAQVAKAI